MNGKDSESLWKPCKQIAGIYVSGDKLVKEESRNKNSRKFLNIKTTQNASKV